MSRTLFYIIIFAGGYLFYKYYQMKRRLDKEKSKNSNIQQQKTTKPNIDWDAEDVDYEEIREEDKK